MGKKTSRPSTKVGSAVSPASGLSNGSRSSILRAAFSPTEYQLALFASVIQGLDAQHLRIHDTNTGRLQCEHALAPKEAVTSLDWGLYGGKNRDQSKKKRKRGSDVNGNADGFDQGDVVIAFGTSSSDIRIFSPTEDKVISTLSGAHEKGIKDFKFTAGRSTQEGWSIGGDNKLIQWDLQTGKSLRTIHLPSSSVFSTLSRPTPSNPPVICASQAPFLIDIENSEEPTKFPAMRNQIHTLISSSEESAGKGSFLASDGERFINVFDTSSQKLVRNLVAENDVSSVSVQSASAEKQVLAAVTADGTIEFFSKPFAQPQNAQNGSAKAARKQLTQKANAVLKIVTSSNATVSVVSTVFHGHEIIVAYAEGGVIPVFERVKFLNESTDELAFTGTKVVAKTKSSSIVASKANGTKDATESRVDETFANVQAGNLIDSDVDMDDPQVDADSDSDSDEEEEDDESKPTINERKSTKASKQAQDEDVEMQSGDDDEEDDEEGEEEEEEEDDVEPSFGELLRASAGQEVDVEAELDDDVNLGTLVPGKPVAAVQQIPTGVSLSTVLTQSLKTNDSDMLESCFHTQDVNTIRSTIQRLDSSLAATLLQKIAERISSRPGRYGRLLVWMQWVCVSHGGALAGQPELLKRISTLYQVVDQRSSSLSSLLTLKGKLDMLEAQLALRRAIHNGQKGEEEDEEDVIYVEGQDDEDSDAETGAKPRTKSIREQAFDEDESLMNGIADESEEDEDDESEDDDDEDDEGILDVEAEESAGSSDAEESLEENEDDEDEGADSDGSMVDFIADTEDSESDDAIAQQPPPSKKSKSGSKKGGKK